MSDELFTHQGASQHTERKEYEIEGVTRMRADMFKNRYFKCRKVIFADVFCGSGKNTVDAEYVVDGSPMRLLNGIFKSNKTKPLPYKFDLWFSDIRKTACTSLERRIKERFKIDSPAFPMQASDAINSLGNELYRNPKTYLFLILDPNGPKDFPKTEVENLLSVFPGRIDIIPYISATTINRCLNSRNKAHYDFKGWLGEIENFDKGFVSALTKGNRVGWIRKPIKGDRQRWTMIPTFGALKPRNDWAKREYVFLDSDEGQETVKFYCGGINNE